MLLPMPVGVAGLPLDDVEFEIPPEVKDSHCKYWWALLGLFGIICTMDFIGGDLFGFIFVGLMAFLVWYMVSSHCKHMLPPCLLLFGLMCAVEAALETITLLFLLGGRNIEHRTLSSTVAPDGVHRTHTITTVIESRPFFDPGQGLVYNLQSASKVASPAAMLLGGLLAYWSYSAFPDLLGETGEAAPIFGGGGGYGLGGPMPGEAAARRPHVVDGRVVGGPRPSGGRGLFEGAGQRLGSG